MNVLAHIYLSGDSDEIIIGNYIGDYVKGRDYLKYPELIRKGIIIHRHIDDFTDRHPVVHRSQRFSFLKSIINMPVWLPIFFTIIF